MIFRVGHQFRQDYIQIRKREPRNEQRSWNDKLIRKLLLTITIADPEQFTLKGKPVTQTGAFVELYNCKNRKQVHEIHGMIEFKKMRVLTVENSRNLGAYRMIEISLLLHNAHMVPRHQDKFGFYINNYIDQDQFNQLYYLDQIEKDIKNADAVACKLGLALTKATNQRLEAAREERRKMKRMVERQNIESMTAKD